MWWKSEVVRVSDRLTCCDWNNSNRQTGHKSPIVSVTGRVSHNPWSIQVCVCVRVCLSVCAGKLWQLCLSDSESLTGSSYLSGNLAMRLDLTSPWYTHGTVANANHTQMRAHTHTHTHTNLFFFFSRLSLININTHYINTPYYSILRIYY